MKIPKDTKVFHFWSSNFKYLFEFLNGRLKKVKRYKKFEAFTNKHLNVKYHPNGDMVLLQKIAEDYDYIVLGSDQIWHPTVNTTPNLFFASFADPKKVIFFSPSFGIQELSPEYMSLVKEHLSNKENITIREVSGQKLIYELTGKDATVLPDPTLCVGSEVWKGVSVKPKAVGKKPYILKYFLGSESNDYKAEFDRICDSYNCDIFEIAKPDVAEGYTTGPQEFLGSILNAEYVITDSFHAVVFCIMFQKPFTVFSRLNKNGENEGLDSRVDTLLQNFNIESRKFSPDGTNEIGDINSSDFAKVLDSLRGTAIDFFKNIL